MGQVKNKSQIETQPHIWQGILEPAIVEAVFKLCQKQTHQPILLVCESQDDIERLEPSLADYLKFHGIDKNIFTYPHIDRFSKTAQFNSQKDILQKRMQVFHVLEQQTPHIVLTTPQAFLQKTIDLNIFQTHSIHISKGTEIDPEKLLSQLIDMGYESEYQVERVGTLSKRGSIVDVFSPQLAYPVRIDFFDDEVETLQFFDPESQRSIQECSEFKIIPFTEMVFSNECIQVARKNWKAHCLEQGIDASKRLAMDDCLENKDIQSKGLSQLLPIFYEKGFSLLSTQEKYVGVACYPFLLKQEQLRLFQGFSGDEKQSLAINENDDPSYIQLPKTKYYEDEERFETYLNEQVQYIFSDIPIQNQTAAIDFESKELIHLKQQLLLAQKSEQVLLPLLQSIQATFEQQKACIFFCGSEQEQKRITGLLEQNDIACTQVQHFKDLPLQHHETVYVTEHHLAYGFEVPAYVCYSSEELFGKKTKQNKSEKNEPTHKDVERISSVGQLEEGQAVVHVDFGIALYKGMKRMQLGPHAANDFLELEYSGGDKIFLPVYRLNRIHKYVGADAKKPTLDKLGKDSKWDDRKQKAKKIIEEMAQDLIELYAKRQVAQKKPYDTPDDMFHNFERAFPFQETVDQNKALEDIEKDLLSDKPMDRLICGDVGFGKTEIALRAAFRSVMQGKQVAVLVPTTVLCQQHYQTFMDRMSEFPVKVDFLSRFKTRKESKDILEKLRIGELDIVIGTHRLLSKDVVFANLGLLVLDEEHRFGVKHKEEIKKYRNLVNVLTLTATPIPRTLQLSMAGIRDLSIINTPPIDRKAVKTLLCQSEDGVIRDAIMKEMARGGQTYFLHNRVETIEAQVMYIKTLVPDARVVFGHGQMSETQLEKVMLSFIKGEADVFVATTIIESGLDIPNANTMLINRADTLGLAQLYQLRGRVGRSDRQASCYLLIPGEHVVGKDALKRLKALQRFTDLGSGLKIAMHDLEIRGAGNLLGQAQSGQIANVGFELYTQLLEREVRKLKGEKVEEDFEPEIQVSLAAFIPEEYIKDVPERLKTYKRFSASKNSEALTALKDELMDRFGPLPSTVENLCEVIELKILAKKCGVIKLSIHEQSPVIEFSDKANINMDRLLLLMRNNKHVRLTPEQKLMIEVDSNLDAYQETRDLLIHLTES